MFLNILYTLFVDFHLYYCVFFQYCSTELFSRSPGSDRKLSGRIRKLVFSSAPRTLGINQTARTCFSNTDFHYAVIFRILPVQPNLFSINIELWVSLTMRATVFVPDCWIPLFGPSADYCCWLKKEQRRLTSLRCTCFSKTDFHYAAIYWTPLVQPNLFPSR